MHRAARLVLEDRGFLVTGVADEGGWAPHLPSNESALELLTAAIERAGLHPGEQMAIAIDAAATQFCRAGRYELPSEGRILSAPEMIDRLDDWSARYPVVSIEDALSEDDWEGWVSLTAKLGKRLQIVGDDLFATSLERLERGIARRAANAILVKMNQIGTLTETFAVVDRAAKPAIAPSFPPARAKRRTPFSPTSPWLPARPD